jgi:peptidyl-tRNA hydrolase
MPKGDISDFVLGKFDADEKKEVGTILEKAVQVCEAWAREGYAEAEKRLSQLQVKK